MDKTKRIFVVEDELIVSMDIQDRLQSMGYEICGDAVTGEEAIKKVDKIRPALVLMDIKLKGNSNGINAANEIQLRYDIPVVYLTSHSDSSTIEKAKATEPYGYLIKPFEERTLFTTIEMALQRHDMQRRLKESEQLLAITLESIGDGVIATDINANIIFMNPIAEQLTGIELSDAKGKNVLEVFNIVNELTGEQTKNPILKALKEGHVVGLANHTILISKEGKRISIDDSAAPIKDKKGNILGAVLVFRDITERRRTENALKESEEKYRTFINNANDTIIISDVDMTIIDTNKKAEQLTGYARKELVGLKFFELFTQVDLDRINKVLKDGILAKSGSINDVSINKKDNSHIPVDINGNLIEYADKKAILTILRDITDRKREEQEREKLISDLKIALEKVKKLSGMLPICASCKKIRDDKGYWNQIEAYMQEHSDIEFSHSLCPDCLSELYPDLYEKKKNQ